MYISTRGNIAAQTSAQAITLGMVPHGGLFVPEKIPHVRWQDYVGLEYAEMAQRIMNEFMDDLPAAAVAEAVSAYKNGSFGTDNPAPLVSVGDFGVLELWHGPTAAFKDMALQVLPYLLASSIKTLGLGEDVLILTATSGDTGKAALEGFKDVPNTRIVVFYPEGGVSAVQERQMITTGGANTCVVAVNGNFDQCQTAVKAVFSSEDLRAELKDKHLFFSSANSINWGRLLPQIVYYFWAYLEAVKQRAVAPGSAINVVVPTGNFGNILAAYYAKQMGLPIAKLICASNKNNILSDFFRTGVYDSNRPFFLTSSPSMDILISSNFERYLFEVADRDPQKIKQWYAELSANGSFQADSATLAAAQKHIEAGWAGEEDVAATIRHIYNEHRYLLDPHTAVAVKVYEDYRKLSQDPAYTIVTATASPYKFAASVLDALDGEAGRERDAWDALPALQSLTGWTIPDNLQDLRQKPAQQVHHCEPQEIAEFIRQLI